jgi:hypothetical protein
MMKSSWIPFVGLCAAMLACGDPPTAVPAPPSVVGCYDVKLGKWSGTRRTPDPPAKIMLMDSVGTYVLEKGKRLVRPNPATAHMPFSMAWWVRLEAEHLRVVFSQGEAAMLLHLVWGWGDDSWRGTAESYTDVATQGGAYTTVILSPRSCS